VAKRRERMRTSTWSAPAAKDVLDGRMAE
jgi:hypothetical protein